MTNRSLVRDETVVRPPAPRVRKRTMQAAVFVAPGQIELREVPVPQVGPTAALVRVTGRPLDRILEAYELFASRRDGVLKIAITP